MSLSLLFRNNTVPKHQKQNKTKQKTKQTNEKEISK